MKKRVKLINTEKDTTSPKNTALSITTVFTVLIRMKSVCLSEGKMTKICPICGNEFEPYHFNQKYCSEACSLKAKKLKERKWKKTHRKKMKESWDKYYAKNSGSRFNWEFNRTAFAF